MQLDTLPGNRIVCWFSHGIASTIAALKAIQANNISTSPRPVYIVDIHLTNEHPDNTRFYREVTPVLTSASVHPIHFVTLQNETYQACVDNVIASTRYMVGPSGARCTLELKKTPRLNWQRVDDIHVFGMTTEESHRIDQLIDNEPDLQLYAPLIEQGITKNDCFKLFNENFSGVTLPIMYKYGFYNNNCIGCVKATSPAYWNLTRQLFPRQFQERARQEELLGLALISLAGNTLFQQHPRTFRGMVEDRCSGQLREIKVQRGGAHNIVVSEEIKGSSPYSFRGKIREGEWTVSTYEMCNDRPEELLSLVDQGKVKKITGSIMRVPLRYLPPEMGVGEAPEVGACGFFCETSEGEKGLTP